MTITRTGILDQFNEKLEKRPILLLSGLYGAGKTQLLEQYAVQKKDEPDGSWNIIRLDYSRPASDLPTSSLNLYDYIVRHLYDDRMNLVLLENVSEFEDLDYALKALIHWSDIRIIVTCSDTSIVRTIQTPLLVDHMDLLTIYPLSYKEYVETESISDAYSARSLSAYLIQGGLPDVLLSRQGIRESMVTGIFSTIILQNLVGLRHFSDVTLMNELCSYLASHISDYSSGRGASQDMRNQVKKVSVNTIYAYLDAFESAYLFCSCNTKNLKTGQVLEREKKSYIIDTSFLPLLSRDPYGDPDALVENIVYIELLRRGYTIHTGRIRNRSISFVAQKEETVLYFQLLSDSDENQEDDLKKKLDALRLIPDHYPKFVLSMDETRTESDGIQILNLFEFLLQGTSL